MFDSLITDRTYSDYIRWRDLRNKGWANMTADDRAEWSTDMKGAYNASDLNRVGGVLNYLRDKLRDAGYLGGNEFTAKVNWTAGDIPTAEQFAAYISAVGTIRNAMSQKATTPPTPANVGSLDYQGANDIESILIDIEELINKMLAARNFCGELFSGEI